MTFLYLAIFAIIGAFARYGKSIVVQKVMGRGFPFGTLSIAAAIFGAYLSRNLGVFASK